MGAHKWEQASGGKIAYEMLIGSSQEDQEDLIEVNLLEIR